jgi:hypothetical protein
VQPSVDAHEETAFPTHEQARFTSLTASAI